MATERDPMDIARERITLEAGHRTGALDLGDLELEELPPEICQLTHLVHLRIGRMGSLRNLPSSYPFTSRARLASRTWPPPLESMLSQVADLTPLAHLASLQSLDCSGCQVADLSPLASLTSLQFLDCSGTRVGDLSPLTYLTSLHFLDCSDTQVADLSPLASLSHLLSLSCSNSKVTNLSPLVPLSLLQSLDCSDNQVVDLSPLASLSSLQSLDCWTTRVVDLSPLASLSSLQSLNCSFTQVADLSPLASLFSLQSLYCVDTQVADITAILALPEIKKIHASYCKLGVVPQALWFSSSLEQVTLRETVLSEVPNEVLADENCLPALRAHYADLDEAAEPARDTKMMVLGNGRAGKTQLVRRLRREPYESGWDSTHGVQVTSAYVDAPDGSELACLHVWDFGGQDIYHGTHTLFTRSRSLFVVVWARDTEHEELYERDGIQFRNHPLAYWVSYVRHHGDANSPVLIVQTKCDRPEDEVRRFPIPDEVINTLPYCRELRLSAANDRGMVPLIDSLGDAVAWLHDPTRQNVAMIGAGRVRVQRQLQKMRDDDAALPPDQRRYRTLDQLIFRDLCAADGGVSDAGHFLAYLNNCGIVFYRAGLFGDRIILDQGWALDAIYAIFHRTKCYRHIRASGGRFTRLLLDATVWSGYAEEEQRLFLSMMRSCGICFVHRGRGETDDETQYVAPDLLPDRDAVQTELDEKWDPTAPCEEVVYTYSFAHAGLMRSLTARIGAEARINAIYWQGGVCAYEATTRSHAIIEYETLEEWRSRLRLRTQGGRAALLLGRLASWIDDQNSQLGIQPEEVAGRDRSRQARPARIAADRAFSHPERPNEQLLAFVESPASKTEYFISYAWCDDTTEGMHREDIVDQICARAEERGTKIMRDKQALATGDSISRFMARIGEGHRIFVILSAKYLRSPFCMTELFEIWRTSQQSDEAFRKRIRVFALDDVRIGTSVERIQHAKHWNTEFEALKSEFRENAALCGIAASRDLQLMQRFAHETADILALIADMVQPRTIDELEKYGLDDPPPK